MSTDPTPIPAAPSGSPVRGNDQPFEQLVVYQHSSMFYWWPIWVVGFLFAAITYLGHYRMAIVPAGTEALPSAHVVTREGQDRGQRDVLVLAEKEKHLRARFVDVDEIIQPTLFVSRYRSLGTMFLLALLLVIFITNVPLRGQWSLIVMLVLILASIIFWLAGFWEIIFSHLEHLSIYINLGGYMMISLVVFILWIVNFYFLDRQRYVVFSPGQVRLRLEIGEGEIIYSTFGMVVTKQRSDLFRHVILGFGSGDLILRFRGHEHPIELHNILNISHVLKRVERLTKEQIVLADDDKQRTNFRP